MKIFEIHFWGISISPTWYGLMYAFAFLSAWLLLLWRNVLHFSQKMRDDFIFFGALGVVLGGRLGYVLFYDLPHYMQHPLEILQPWKGGMSFHGGLLGVILAGWMFARKYKISFLSVMDVFAWVAPLGIFFGRIGNFINKELLGFQGYTGWLSVKTPNGTYFPTPLLEACTEGVLLFLLTTWTIFSYKRRASGDVSILFLLGYAIFRIFNEFFRDPDPQIGYFFGTWGTQGQLLSICMLVVAAVLFRIRFSRT